MSRAPGARRRSRLGGALLAVCAVVLAGAAGAGAAPTDDLRRSTDRVIAILQTRALTPDERRAAVRDAALDVFDLPETARRALGTHWASRTAAEREEFVELFRGLLERTYLTRLEEYGGERVEYLSERVDGEAAVVRAQIVTRTGFTVPVESRLTRAGEHWRVYDLVVANMSLIANYRSQFDRVIRASSYEELVRRLRDRIARIDESPKAPRGPGR